MLDTFLNKALLSSVIFLFSIAGIAQDITITVDVTGEKTPVSPYIYGRNNNFSDVFGTATTDQNIQLYKEAGLRFARETGGNNSTKYNWRKKLSSHPDWYNNVYAHDWDYASQTIEDKMTGLQTMWAFQLIGKAASNADNNFNDWAYNQSQWWEGTAQNLAGGGEVNPDGGGKALKEGNPDLYLMDWNADSTTGILDHFFGTNGLGLDQNKFQYWNMDNEPEIWNGTHDDVMSQQLKAADFMQLYFQVAKKAREKFPDIKLVGPVTANEWQWYKWADESLNIDGKYYSWLEYFIKSVAEEEQASGVKLLDVLDLHWYPSETNNADVVQSYRIFFDETYDYPGANGVKTINGNWDTSQTKEFIFKRINDWLDQYFGENHGITLGLTEFGSGTSDPNANAVLYASMLGTFAQNGVEIFTPWTWKTGMWETLHLFSRYAKGQNVPALSSDEETVSAYSTVNDKEDSLTVMLVNRSGVSKKVNLKLKGFSAQNGDYSALELSSLPSAETFLSHTDNALKDKQVSVASNSFEITLSPMSVTAVLLSGGVSQQVLGFDSSRRQVEIFPNPVNDQITLKYQSSTHASSRVTIYDQSGKRQGVYDWDMTTQLQLNLSTLQTGVYILRIENDYFVTSHELIKTD